MYLKFAGKRGESARDGGGFFLKQYVHGFVVASLTLLAKLLQSVTSTFCAVDEFR